mgnify:CR=1 FL=1
MTPRIITSEEARALREAATPGPWTNLPLTAEPIGPDLVVRVRMRDGDSDLCAAAPDLAATVEALHAEVARLREIEHGAGELLARIHRDGGHHINNVGWKQAFLDADDRVVEWLGRDLGDSDGH